MFYKSLAHGLYSFKLVRDQRALSSFIKSLPELISDKK